MSVRQLRRDAALERVVDHLLEHGLGKASLRALAAAAGTSDRMLLYYFADKDEIMIAAFERLAERLSGQLAEMLPEGRQSLEVLLQQMWRLQRTPGYEPYLRIWYEALGRASHGEALYLAVANRMMDIWQQWFGQRLAAAPELREEQSAAFVVAASGVALLRYVGREREAEAAVRLLSRKVRQPRRVARGVVETEAGG